MSPPDPHAGTLLRSWRQRRSLTQLDLAHRAGVSSRHLSFIENGRARPTSRMILRLSGELSVPLREQNRLLLAGGFAPAYPEHALDQPSMAQVAAAIEGILAAQLPYPALVVDRGWELVSANDAVYALLDGVSPHLLEPPVNVIRLSLDPEGLAPRIGNLEQWRHHLLTRLRHEHDATGDPLLRALVEELSSGHRPRDVAEVGLLVPLRLRVRGHDLSFLSTTTVFGTAIEVTSSEVAIEAFYPAEDDTRRLLLDGLLGA